MVSNVCNEMNRASYMKLYISNLSLNRLLLTLSSIICINSCVTPDPMYVQNAGRIRDTDYSKDQITGTWATMFVSQVQTLTRNRENKSYYDLQSGGEGRARQVDRNLITGSHISMDAPIRWVYLGQNRWRISIPGSSAWRVTSSNNMTKGECPPFEIVVRYLDGRLYTNSGRVWVKAEPGEVSRMAQRLRSQPKLLRVVAP